MFCRASVDREQFSDHCQPISIPGHDKVRHRFLLTSEAEIPRTSKSIVDWLKRDSFELLSFGQDKIIDGRNAGVCCQNVSLPGK
ncbi:hypothetical protein AVEN_219927-1 [Araneus ventricosus]|uniref:Uncharacterized protein n=1 Tax=Araneus ventricosus TaxID=182803 RepID=A0A4Y2TGE2_ARAVE|nr:hypothetical protein AVEN_219927-1 [Araneus ventricosus]